ncbi:hypothetical protein PAMC26577_39915 [Caballeronia sordidicola]|uniref:Uncharacterized protein n=1 Tax=Caballeronia sordidicola TaxID=196367 RepID=A0A242M318_CABSO|nr:hypothetical protein PAMC26577_39915 [Caballeronia sordidicola]
MRGFPRVRLIVEAMMQGTKQSSGSAHCHPCVRAMSAVLSYDASIQANKRSGA